MAEDRFDRFERNAAATLLFGSTDQARSILNTWNTAERATFTPDRVSGDYGVKRASELPETGFGSIIDAPGAAYNLSVLPKYAKKAQVSFENLMQTLSQEEPSMGDIGSALADGLMFSETPDFENTAPGFIGAEGSYSILQDSDFENWPPYLKNKFKDARSAEEATYRYERYMQELGWLETLDDAGGVGFLSEALMPTSVAEIGLAAGLSFFGGPLGRIGQVGFKRAGRELTKRFFAASAALAPGEIERLRQNETASPGETFLAIGTGAAFFTALSPFIGRNADLGGQKPFTLGGLGDDIDIDTGGPRPDPFSPEALLGPRPDGPPQGSGGRSSVGAAESDYHKRYTYDEELHREGIVPAFGLEKLPVNPMVRLLASPSLTARTAAPTIAPLGGVQQNKNLEGDATFSSAETAYKAEYPQKISGIIRSIDDWYFRYAANWDMSDASLTGSRPTMRMRAEEVLKRANIRERLMGTSSMSEPGTDIVSGDPRERFQFRVPTGRESLVDFNEDIAMAMRRGDLATHLPQGNYRLAVEAAVKEIRPIVDEIAERANNVGLFERPLEREISKIHGEIKKMKESGTTLNDPDMQEMRYKVAAYERRLDNLRKHGPVANNADSYFMRVWRHDEVLKRMDELKDRFVIYWKGQNTGETTSQLARRAIDTIEKGILGRNPWFEIKNNDWTTNVGEFGAFREQSVDIPDYYVEDFLNNNASAVLRFYVGSTGKDIALAESLGGNDISMKDTIDAVRKDYEDILDFPAKKAQDRQKIVAQMKRDISDIEGLRDRYRGTYGLPSDPYRPISRFVRAAKQYNVLLYGGQFAVAAMADIGRPIMTEGFKVVYGDALARYASPLRKQIAKMQKEELHNAGVGLEMALGSRAQQLADTADMFGDRFRTERYLNMATAAQFVVNGMHLWTDAAKEISGSIIMGRMNRSILEWSRGTITKEDRTKLARSGIDKNMSDRIAGMLQKHGSDEYGEIIDDKVITTPEGVFRVDENGERYRIVIGANTADWEDVGAVRAYRQAINYDVERTIITPESGDRALWTSTEFGSVIAQFKSFGQTAHMKMLIPGLQEKNAAFLQGATALFAMGIAVAEIKRWLYGDTRKRELDDVLMDGIDKSGLMAWFADVNNAIEVLSDHQIGLNPMLGTQQPYGATRGQVAGTLGGATGSTLNKMIDVGSDVASGDINHWTKRKAKGLIPYNNLAAVQAVGKAFEY